jgi:hypothetical protein
MAQNRPRKTGFMIEGTHMQLQSAHLERKQTSTYNTDKISYKIAVHMPLGLFHLDSKDTGRNPELHWKDNHHDF